VSSLAVGWDLTLEYAVAAASVARGWSQYMVVILKMMHINLPEAITKPPW
jgi:APA family basic amino acid/polyamine antiporter